MAEALSSSENICWTFYWVTFPLDKIRRQRKRMSSCVNVLCFTRMICQKITKVQKDSEQESKRDQETEKERAVEKGREKGGCPLNFFVSGVYTCCLSW